MIGGWAMRFRLGLLVIAFVTSVCVPMTVVGHATMNVLLEALGVGIWMGCVGTVVMLWAATRKFRR